MDSIILVKKYAPPPKHPLTILYPLLLYTTSTPDQFIILHSISDHTNHYTINIIHVLLITYSTYFILTKYDIFSYFYHQPAHLVTLTINFIPKV